MPANQFQPTILYKGEGPHQRKGGTYSSIGANTQEEFDGFIADGWFTTLPEAIEAHDNPKPVQPLAISEPKPDLKK
jgi:hypothetical protein